MRNLLSVVCIFTAIAYQSAHARDYYSYERVGRDDAEYVYINGVRYARVPQNDSSQYQNTTYRAPNYNHSRYQKTQRKKEPERYSSAVRPYIGLDVGRSSMKIHDKEDRYGLKDVGMNMGDTFDTKHMNFSGVLGLKINPSWAVELFYQKSEENDKNLLNGRGGFSDVSVKSALSYDAFGADVIMHKPLNDVLDMLFGFGLAQYRFEGKISEQFYNYVIDDSFSFEEKDDVDVMAARLGIGLQYYLTDRIALQAMGRYIHMFDDDIVKRIIEMSLGVRYLF